MPAKKLKVDPSHPVVRSLLWIFEHKKDRSGAAWNPSTLSAAAGLVRGHIGNILGGHQSADITRATAGKIAKAVDVRTDWIMSFDGDPGHFADSGVRRIPDSGDPCPSRLPLLAALREKKEDAAIVAAIEAEVWSIDPGEKYWWSRPAHYRALLASVSK